MQKAAALIFITICALSALSWVEGAKNKKPSASMAPANQFESNTTTTKSPTNTTTTISPTNTTTTKSPTNTTTTTISPTNTTTTKSPTNTTTTTISPTNTTTTKSPTNTTTTISPTNTTTTKSPTNTTTQPTTKPTTTPPSPTPSTNLTVGNYNVSSQGKLCLMAKVALQIRLTTEQNNGTFIVQPSMTKSGGDCKEMDAILSLSFSEGSINFHFTKSKDMVSVDALSFTLKYPLEKGGVEYSASNNSINLFSARSGHSYSCRSESVYMGNGLYLDVTQARMQALDLSNGGFGRPDACPADQPDYGVAIGVGVTLLVLIVVVVIVYLLGRRKRTDGYQSL